MKSEEIAKIVGMSRSTVSRVINNYPNVTEETRKKVMDAIEKYNYSPNAFARTLAGKGSETIGVFFVIEQGSGSERQLFNNDFFTAYLDAIVDAANERGYYVLVQTVYSDSDLQRVNKAFVEKRIDGGIIIGTRDTTLEALQLHVINQPIVVFDMEEGDLPRTTNEAGDDISDSRLADVVCMNTDDYDGVSKVMDHLIEQGKRRIGFIRGIEETRSARQRYRAYQDSLTKHGIDIDSSMILEGRFNRETTVMAVQSMIDTGKIPDVLIAANDDMALIAINVLKEAGYRIPEDLGVIGFDNTRTGSFSRPTLSSIAPDYVQMAEDAVTSIMTRYQLEGTKTKEHKVYPMHFYRRESI